MVRTEISEDVGSDLVEQFEGLEISVRRRRSLQRAVSSSAGVEPAVESQTATSATSFQSAGEAPLAGPRASATSVADRRAFFESELLAARTPEDILALDLRVVEHLLPRLRAAAPSTS